MAFKGQHTLLKEVQLLPQSINLVGGVFVLRVENGDTFVGIAFVGNDGYQLVCIPLPLPLQERDTLLGGSVIGVLLRLQFGHLFAQVVDGILVFSPLCFEVSHALVQCLLGLLHTVQVM